METRSRARVAQSQVSPEGVPEGPESRSPTSADEDLGLVLTMGDREAPIVGGGQPQVRMTTSTSGDVPVAMEWAPTREPVIESSGSQPTPVSRAWPQFLHSAMIAEQFLHMRPHLWPLNNVTFNQVDYKLWCIIE